MFRIKQGLHLPINGAPEPRLAEVAIKHQALLGMDYVGLKPRMLIKVGDRVRIGQPLIEDKANPGVTLHSPACGTVAAIHRGERRVLQSVVVAVDGEEAERFPACAEEELSRLAGEAVEARLIASGLWASLRTRPFSRIPRPGSRPRSIFVNLMDTNPLAVDPAVVLKGQEALLASGLKVLARLTEGPLFVCKAPELALSLPEIPRLRVEEFSGPHPAGLPGTHIHLLDPVGERKTVWTINYQDLLAVGILFREGRIETRRTISLAGPGVKEPCHYRVPLGASLDELCAGRLNDGEQRVVSGSVFSGHRAAGPLAWLGRYHHQVSVLPEGRERELFGWHMPGFDKFSVKMTFAAQWFFPNRRFDFTTSTGGSRRAIVPVGSYEKVMPLDTEPVFLLRALASGDAELAARMGALELDEEDVGLLTFVCPSKMEYGPLLRSVLTRIEREGS